MPATGGRPNHFADAFLLMFSGDRHVDDVVKQTAVTDDPPDTDDFFVVWNANRLMVIIT